MILCWIRMIKLLLMNFFARLGHPLPLRVGASGVAERPGRGVPVSPALGRASTGLGPEGRASRGVHMLYLIEQPERSCLHLCIRHYDMKIKCVLRIFSPAARLFKKSTFCSWGEPPEDARGPPGPRGPAMLCPARSVQKHSGPGRIFPEPLCSNLRATHFALKTGNYYNEGERPRSGGKAPLTPALENRPGCGPPPDRPACRPRPAR